MNNVTGKRWMVSLHGGHSGSYCDHAAGTLREVLNAAVAKGFQSYGVSEHAPREAENLLYPEEVEMGWDVAKLISDFERYAHDITALAEEFADRLSILKGLEAEAAPRAGYVEIMLGYKRRFDFDYMVGSVHYLEDISIDGPQEMFDQALESHGGLERLCVSYYRAVAEMVENLRPEVVAHLDLVRKNAPSNESVEVVGIREAARATLDVIREHGCILDLNTAGYRKGLGSPYPASWLVHEAHTMGIPFCFGDDSHGPEQVGAGIDGARNYLLENGVDTITTLVKADGEITKQTLSLVDS